MSKRQELIEASREHLRTLEAHLAGALRPIQPPRGFVQHLRERVRLPEPRLLAKRLTDWQFILIVVGGVVSAAVLIATVARALFHLFRRDGGGAVM